MSPPSLRRRLIGLAGALALPLPARSQSTAAPSPTSPALPTAPASGRPIVLIVPYTAGGASDYGARLLVPELGRRLGQTVVIENIGGAGGALGVQRLVRAAPDGQTMLYGSLSEAVMVPMVNPGVGYRSEDLMPAALVARTPLAFVARPDFPASTMEELFALLRRRPGSLTYGSPGIGTFQHVIAETVKARTATFMVHIPYRGGQNIVNDVIAGQIDIGVTTAPNVVALLSTGRLKALGVSSATRISVMPGVPAFGESAALKGLDLQTWGMVFLPAATPAPLVQRVNAAINETMALPVMREARARLGSEAVPAFSPAEVLAFYRAERETYRPIASRIKPE